MTDDRIPGTAPQKHNRVVKPAALEPAPRIFRPAPTRSTPTKPTVSAHELGGAAGGGEIAGGDSHRSSHPGPRPREAASHMTSPTAAMTLIATAAHLSTDSPASARGTTAAATPIQRRTIPAAYAQRARLAQML
jgi:hypothetical protein